MALQFGFVLLAAGDFVADGDQGLARAAGREQGHLGQLEYPFALVGQADHHFVVQVAAVCPGGFVGAFEFGQRAVGELPAAGQLTEGLAPVVAVIQAAQAQEDRVGLDQAVIAILQADGIGHGVDQRAQLRLAVLQLLGVGGNIALVVLAA